MKDDSIKSIRLFFNKVYVNKLAENEIEESKEDFEEDKKWKKKISN